MTACRAFSVMQFFLVKCRAVSNSRKASELKWRLASHDYDHAVCGVLMKVAIGMWLFPWVPGSGMCSKVALPHALLSFQTDIAPPGNDRASSHRLSLR
jgi:hypothetical protein